MTKEIEKRFSRVFKGLPHMARVTVQLAEDFEEAGVTIQCTAPPILTSQGTFEDVPANGYYHWQRGAALGAEYALEVAGQKDHSIIVSRIVGLTTDTNPTIIGATAALAVWEAIEFQPVPEQIKRLERHIFGSWQLPEPFDAMPDFHSDPGEPSV